MSKLQAFLEAAGSFLEKSAVPRDIRNAPPKELHLELTYRCNTSCIMCNLRYLSSPADERGVGDIIRAIERSELLKDLGFIVLSGGEPWLKEGFLDLVVFLRKRFPDAELLILSNLIDRDLAVRNLERINTSVGLDRISLGSSLDGIGESYDLVRGRKGGFEALTESLAAIRSLFPGLFVSLNFTVTPENCGQMLPVFRWCRARDYHVSFQVMVQKKETRRFAWEARHREVIEEQLGSVIEELHRLHGLPSHGGCELLSNEGVLSLLLGLHYIGKYMRSARRFFPNCPCGEKYAMLDPFGNLYFCPVHKDRIAGNVAADGFDRVWTSEKAAGIREFFNRRQCHCWLTCTNGYMLGDAIAAGKNRLLETVFDRDAKTSRAKRLEHRPGTHFRREP